MKHNVILRDWSGAKPGESDARGALRSIFGAREPLPATALW